MFAGAKGSDGLPIGLSAELNSQYREESRTDSTLNKLPKSGGPLRDWLNPEHKDILKSPRDKAKDKVMVYAIALQQKKQNQRDMVPSRKRNFKGLERKTIIVNPSLRPMSSKL